MEGCIISSINIVISKRDMKKAITINLKKHSIVFIDAANKDVFFSMDEYNLC